jgi:hypothetical protein
MGSVVNTRAIDLTIVTVSITPLILRGLESSYRILIASECSPNGYTVEMVSVLIKAIDENGMEEILSSA